MPQTGPDPEICSPHRIVCPWCGRAQHHASAESGDLVMRCTDDTVRRGCGKHFRVFSRSGSAAVLPMTEGDAAAWYNHRRQGEKLMIALDAYFMTATAP